MRLGSRQVKKETSMKNVYGLLNFYDFYEFYKLITGNYSCQINDKHKQYLNI